MKFRYRVMSVQRTIKGEVFQLFTCVVYADPTLHGREIGEVAWTGMFSKRKKYLDKAAERLA